MRINPYIGDEVVDKHIAARIAALPHPLQTSIQNETFYDAFCHEAESVGIPEEIQTMLCYEILLILLELLPVDEFAFTCITRYGIPVQEAFALENFLKTQLDPQVVQELETVAEQAEDPEEENATETTEDVPVVEPIQFKPETAPEEAGVAEKKPEPLTRESLSEMFPGARTMKSDIAEIQGEEKDSNVPRFRKPFTSDAQEDSQKQGVPQTPPPPQNSTQ